MKKIDGWYNKKRQYIHFDAPISFERIVPIVSDPTAIANRSFLPFLHTQIHSSRVFIDQDGKLSRKVKTRDIRYASHIDSHIYSFYSKNIGLEYERVVKNNNIGDSILGFRSIKENESTEGMCNIHFAKKAFD